MTLEIDRKNTGLSFSPEKIQLLKDTVCKGANDAELEMFLYICNRSGLDPFMKQIYSIPRGGQRTTQTSIDGFRLIAERTGRYSPGRESSFVYDEKGAIISATSWVRKMTADGTWHDVGATVYMSEFKGSTPFWIKMPHVMLSKVAEAVALRKAFPADLSGIYTAEEMDQAEAEIIEPVVDIKPLEDLLCLGTEDNVKQLYIAYFDACKAKFKKTKRTKWASEWLRALEQYQEVPSELNTDVNNWHEKQLAKKENVQ